MTDVIVDYYDLPFGNSYILADIHPSDSSLPSAQGQSFKFTTGPDAYYLKSAKFKVDKNGIPTGCQLQAHLYAHTGTFGLNGKPTGSVLSSSDIVAMPTKPLPQWLTFTFSSPYYEMQKNTPYCIVMTLYSGTVDGSNYIKIWGDRGDDGNGDQYINSAWSSSTTDRGFYVYGEEVPAAGPVKPRRMMMGVGR